MLKTLVKEAVTSLGAADARRGCPFKQRRLTENYTKKSDK